MRLIENLLEKGEKLHDGWYYYNGEYYLVLSEDDIKVYPKVEDPEIITKYGEELQYNWYKYHNKYYRIYRNKFYNVANNLRVVEEENSFIYPSRDGSASVVCIGNYIGLAQNTSISSIIPFKDYFYICNTADGSQRELRHADTVILYSDDIYRIDSGEFVAISNGVHWLIHITPDNVTREPIGKNTIKWSNNKYYEILPNGEEKEIEKS